MGKITRRGAAAGAFALAGALVFSGSAFAADTDGGPVDIDGTPYVQTGINDPNIWRFADDDRVSTAIQAAERTKGTWGKTAIIANSEVFADALAATPLADVKDAPVLLSKPGGEVDARVISYLKANNFRHVTLVGGSDVFGASAKEQLQDEGLTVIRAEGANRYQTAIELADRAIRAAKDANAYKNVNVFLADGLNFPDALAAGAAAAANDGVVLLTKGGDGLDSKTFEYISENKFPFYEHASTVAVGGPAAAAAAEGYNGDPIEVNDNVVGSDRYETAVLLAGNYVAGAKNAVIASGQNFPDGVVAGAYASNVDGPLLLTKEGNLTKVTKEYLEDNRNDFNGTGKRVGNIFVFGGLNSVSKNVTTQLAGLEWNW